jgi:hypothetical protein
METLLVKWKEIYVLFNKNHLLLHIISYQGIFLLKGGCTHKRLEGGGIHLFI